MDSSSLKSCLTDLMNAFSEIGEKANSTLILNVLDYIEDLEDLNKSLNKRIEQLNEINERSI